MLNPSVLVKLRGRLRLKSEGECTWSFDRVRNEAHGGVMCR